MDAPRSSIRAARRLRRAMSLPEVMLWKALRLSPAGLRFRPQHPMGRYVLDFYCAELRLAVEVDGIAHRMGERPERDAARDAWLSGQDVRVIRVPAAEVLRNVDRVVQTLLQASRP